MDAQQFDITIEKTDKGFGIYFAKIAGSDSVDLLVVDGFVDGKNQNREVFGCLQLGDILTKVNGKNVEGKEVADILGLLRSADSGENTLSFLRNVPIDATSKDTKSTQAIKLAYSATEAPKSGFMGALLKVKTKIRAEIDGDEEELLREQLEDAQFEKLWLEEFDALKKQHIQKWETCTYTADEFCGLLYRSSDAQQKEYLQQEYPTLMDAWKDGCVSSSSSRIIPEWPAVEIAYDSAVNYDPVDGLELVAPSSAMSGANTRSIHCSHWLASTIECLRVEFMWRTRDIRAFSHHLDDAGISSCSSLLEALNASSSHFERNFQSMEYPRLTKTMLRALREKAQDIIAAPSENLFITDPTVESDSSCKI